LKKIDFGQTIGVLANLAVLAGIVFLAFELNQNSDLLASQARGNLVASRAAASQSIIQNSGGIADVIYKARIGDELTGVEEWRLTVFRALVIDNFASIYQEVKHGPLTETDIPVRQWAGTFLNDPGLREWWKRQDAHDPDFVRYVDEVVLTYPGIFE